jgi:peptidoglycan/LPS O-acetylase OafA/YrhL
MIVVGLLWLCSTRIHRQGPAAAAAAADSYAVYIVHAPVLILTSLALRNLVLPALLKFVLVLMVVILLSFALAHGIRALPGVRSIL